jgi:RimJ/RimL family protein N-acetyltransferase
VGVGRHDGFEDVTARRLVLHPAEDSDLGELHRLYADPEAWAADPRSRHATPVQTAALIERSPGRPGGWTGSECGARTAPAPRRPGSWSGSAAATSGRTSRGTSASVSPVRTGGQGPAQEIIAAGVGAARVVRPALPFIAYLLEGNARSQTAVERAGLRRVWRGPDAGNPDPAAVRLLYADRRPDPSLVAVLTAD